jgi:heparan-alpha-glucosaminide N-acetyltransferase
MLAKNNRISSIDIMRGLTLFLMLFVNDLYTPGVPKWLVHTSIEEDGMGLADWVFPGFLFMVGLSIPFAFMAREKLGQSNMQLLAHILIRTLSLILIGVFIVNSVGYNAALTGINKNLWLILVYGSVFLIWNKYPKESTYNITFKILKVLGVLGLVVLATVYRSGTTENPGWMRIAWWGILGLIGWGYLVSALTYFWLKDRIGAIVGVCFVFIVLNILAQTSYTAFLNPLKPILGVVIRGNVPSIVLSGLIIGVLLKKYSANYKRFLSLVIPIGLLCVALAFILRNWFIISKLMGTPSWVMLCNGISILVFALMFYMLDVKKWHRWSSPFLPAGKNSLTTYLAPDILYYMIWGLNLTILFYKQSEMPWLAVSGSLLWAFAMIGFAALLSKARVRLKL